MKVPKEVRDLIHKAIAESEAIDREAVKALIKQYTVGPDINTLIETDLNRTAQRLIAGCRDKEGVREALAHKTPDGDFEYVVIENTTNTNTLRQIDQTLQKKMRGLERSRHKVDRRHRLLEGQTNVWNIIGGNE